MTLTVKIIQRLTGNTTAVYNGKNRTTTGTAQPAPVKPAPAPKPRAIRTSTPRKVKPATPETIRATLAEIAAESPRVILATVPKWEESIDGPEPETEFDPAKFTK